MYKIGIQTRGILEKGKIESGLAAIKDAGFDCVDFNLDAFLTSSEILEGKLNRFFDKSEEDLKKYFMAYKELMNKYGVAASQMHAPYPIMVYGREQQNEYLMRTVIPKSFYVANLLEIPYIVLHPWKLQHVLGKNEEEQQNLTYFKSLIPLVKKYRVTVCLENLYENVGGRIVEGVCADPATLVKWIRLLNKEAGEEIFGACLDTGHMNLVHRTPCETIKILGRHLKILHLHDNDGILDLHQMPYTFAGKKEDTGGTDWNEVLKGLKEIGYDGVLSFETFPCMSSFPRAVRAQVLKTLAETGRYFSEELESE